MKKPVTIRPFSASYECGRRLAAAGIPLDCIENLPCEDGRRRGRVDISALGGVFRSRVLDLQDRHITYLLGVRLTTTRSRGIVIVDWSVTTPWDHFVSWDCDAADILPVSDHPTYAKLFNSRLSSVLNEKLQLSRGRPVEGLLCGRAPFESIPKSIANGSTLHAKLKLTDETGQRFTQDIEMIVDRRRAIKIPSVRRKGRLFDKRDSVASVSTKQKPKALRKLRRWYAEWVREEHCRTAHGVIAKRK